MKVRDAITALIALPMDDELKLRFTVYQESVDLDIGECRRVNAGQTYSVIVPDADPIVSAEIKLEAP